MDIQKAKLLLEKVNALLKSVSMDEDNISNIEKDLMLSYIRQLYDSVLDTNTKIQTTTPAVTKKEKVTARPVAPPPRIIEIEREEPTPPPPKIETTYTPPRIIEVSESLTDMSKPTPPPPPKPKAKKSTPKPTPAPPKVVTTTTTTEEQEGLFEFKAAKELSEKLSERPIRDLTKAFALNDKLLYANELFGKELVIFNEAIRQLNSYSSFDEAKGYLSQLANKYHWTKGGKAKLAKSFIKLIRRRYI